MLWDYILRIAVAALLGGAIGLEREYRAKEAGFRTHFLVALGSALLMVLSQYGFAETMEHYADNPNVRLDVSRIAAQVVSGIGFIGARTIIFQKRTVHGLTTAAGVWVAAAIGMACGSGMFWMAIAATVLVLLGLEAMNFFLGRFGSRNIFVKFTAESQADVENVLNRLRRRGMELESYKMEEKQTGGHAFMEVSIDLKVLRKRYRYRVLDLMSEFDGVTVEELT